MKKRNYIPQEKCVCITVRRIAQKVTDLYDKALEPVGVSVNQYSLLVNIGRMEGCGIGELAQQVGQEKSTLVRTLQPLFREGLIEDKSTSESRRRQLYLTQFGDNVLKKAFPLWKSAQEQAIAMMGNCQSDLMNILTQMEG